MADVANAFGYVAAVSLSLMAIPQVVHTFRTRDASGLSWMFLWLQFITGTSFTIYGFGVWHNTDLVTALPLLIPNPLNFLCVLALMTMKVVFTAPSPESSPVGDQGADYGSFSKNP